MSVCFLYCSPRDAATAVHQKGSESTSMLLPAMQSKACVQPTRCACYLVNELNVLGLKMTAASYRNVDVILK